ncbi:MAG: hypothetical protein LBM08_00765 [Dysgonamonadaceae bacterium]|jgi:hypothetical protein|nr:hypothetical protein [Dysgonamonadaceae bacterium]
MKTKETLHDIMKPGGDLVKVSMRMEDAVNAEQANGGNACFLCVAAYETEEGETYHLESVTGKALSVLENITALFIKIPALIPVFTNALIQAMDTIEREETDE